MLEGATSYTWQENLKRWAPSVIIGAIGAYFIAIRGQYTYLDYFALIIHEAGHFCFGFMGETIEMLGGTLMQIIVPVLLIIYCFSNRLRLYLQISLFLLLHNFINISVYAADAQARSLPLFGKPGVKHDWYYLLSKYDILEYTPEISTTFVVLACLSLILLIIVPYFYRD